MIDCCEGQSNCNHQDIEDVSAFPDDSYSDDINDNNDQSNSEESSEHELDNEMSNEQKISSIFKQRQKKDKTNHASEKK